MIADSTAKATKTLSKTKLASICVTANSATVKLVNTKAAATAAVPASPSAVPLTIYSAAWAPDSTFIEIDIVVPPGLTWQGLKHQLPDILSDDDELDRQTARAFHVDQQPTSRNAFAVKRIGLGLHDMCIVPGKHLLLISEGDYRRRMSAACF
jgi:hypothetical protein